MADYYNPKNADPQKLVGTPGLEVGPAPMWASLPEVVPTPSPRSQDTEKIPYAKDDAIVQLKRGVYVSRRKLFVGIAIVITIFVIIAAVVGAVVGVNLKRNQQQSNTTNGHQDPQGSNGTTTTPTTTPPPQGNIQNDSKIRNESALAVTGWRDGKEYSVRIFYQDEDGFLGVTSMHSTDNKAWSKGAKFVKAKIGTPLAASCHNQSIYDASKTAMETRVFYLDENSILQEFVFEDDDETGKGGTLNAQNIKPSPDTRLAAYWPSITFQNSDNSISELRYNCTTGAKDCWNNQNLGISGPGPTAPLALVPMGRSMTGIMLYYENENHELVNSGWDNGSGQWTSQAFSQPIPPSAPAAVLATPRNDTSSNALEFFVLYQDNDSTIQFTRRSAAGWISPTTSDAFNHARPAGTNIACLTPANWFDQELVIGNEMNRCFYIGGLGNLRSLQWNGKTWLDLGIIDGVGVNK